MANEQKVAGPPEQPAAPTAEGKGSGPTAQEAWVDYTELASAARARRRSLSRLPTLVWECLRLVWSTDPRTFLASAGLQLLGGAIVAVQVLVTKAVLQAVLDAERTGGSASRAIVPILILAVITAFTGISTALLAQQARLLSELTTRSTWGRILDVAGAVDLRAYEGSEFYDQLRRVQTNAVVRPYLVVQGQISLLGGLTGTLGLVAAIITLQPLLLPLLLLSGVPLWFAGRWSSRREFAFTVAQTAPVRMRTYLSGVLTGRDEAKELRAFGLVTALRSRYDAVYGEYVTDLRKHLRWKSRVAVGGSAASAALLTGTLLVLVLLISRHQVSLAEAGAALVAIRMLSSQITALFNGLQQIFESSLFLEDLQRFLAVRPAIEQAQAGDPAPSRFDRLDVENVSFAYPGSQQPVLHDVSVTLKAGEVVAVVGENGSGKTTLAKLLAALYEPDEGAISWDGVDIKRFDRRSLRRSIAVIFQDFVRYQLSARENVGAGRPEAIDDQAAIEQAAKQSGAHEFLSALPDGYETLLSKAFKGGRDLSLGQWQRVALARAFYRNAPFVILDEPSASLDPRAEAELFARIRELLAGRTVLLISHRFSSVRHADRIYVMRGGRVVESGTHEQLMAERGLYADLFSLQAAAYMGTATSPS